ncbi:hypothetical protein F5148DRAFT_1190821 [Russula earlei]|uniref:Uncharacterized protein n=1 Tax=Russula earlei TaxID=71964 RepID=A0ACC0UD86_9AGAM|nr:hypothetical protein F5148DRAFT_1190821 [Russula earlei]
MSVNEDTRFPAKRQRLDQREVQREEERMFSLLSCLERIPLEILAEILFHVNSPNDVLSVARCSKHLGATLLNPSNVMIWRRIRRHCVVPDLPPPFPGWSESAYAALIFDPGNCYICGVPTKRIFLSFVARVRLCGKPECRRKFFDDHIMIPTYPDQNFSDSKRRFYGARLRYLEIPVFSPTGLRVDKMKTESEYGKMIREGKSQDEYLRLREADIHRQHQIFEHAKALYQWCQGWRNRSRITKTSNMAFAQGLSTEACWDLQDLLNTTTFCSLQRSYNACLQTISVTDVRLLIKKIDAEILTQLENRERRQKAHVRQTKRGDISRYYDRLVKGKKHPVVPILAEFRALPIIKALQDRDDVMPVVSDSAHSPTQPSQAPRTLESELMRSDLIGCMITNDLEKWVDSALVAFDSILGKPSWKSAAKRVLHPAERVTARFICTRCNSTLKKHATTESLDFRGACAHQCGGQSKKAALRRKWKADQFVPDGKAIDVLTAAVSQLGFRADHRETVSLIESVGARFLCKSCDLPIVMNFQRLVGHCRRHHEMQIELLSPVEALNALFKHPYEEGAFAKYSVGPKKAKQMKVFGCRHCPDTRAEPTSRSSDAYQQKRFTFNGLISHAKEKWSHGIIGTRYFP